MSRQESSARTHLRPHCNLRTPCTRNSSFISADFRPSSNSAGQDWFGNRVVLHALPACFFPQTAPRSTSAFCLRRSLCQSGVLRSFSFKEPDAASRSFLWTAAVDLLRAQGTLQSRGTRCWSLDGLEPLAGTGSTSGLDKTCGSKLSQGSAGFSLWFHVPGPPGFHFGYRVLTHSHLICSEGFLFAERLWN